jgi:glycosyltransferase involved in cell wall biosynthesis
MILLENRIEHSLPPAVTIHALAARLSHGWLGKRLLARHLRRHLAQRRDLVVSTLPFADEVTTLADLPRHWCRIANTLGSEVGRLAQRSPTKARRRLARYRRLYGSRPLIAVSEGVAADLRQSLNIASRIETIPNPFDFAAMREAATEPAAGLPDRPYVLHIGRFAAQKRHDLLLDAWARVDGELRLVLLTEPDAMLQAMIATRGLSARVHIAGFQPNPYPWIAGAKLLVLCSDHEGLPNVLIESLACGTPVISTDCPSGPREILAALPECLVPCGDAKALAVAITKSLASPPEIFRADLSAYGSDAVAAVYERLARES